MAVALWIRCWPADLAVLRAQLEANKQGLIAAFHYHPPITLIWLKYCWNGCKTASHPSSALWYHVKNIMVYYLFTWKAWLAIKNEPDGPDVSRSRTNWRQKPSLAICFTVGVQILNLLHFYRYMYFFSFFFFFFGQYLFILFFCKSYIYMYLWKYHSKCHKTNYCITAQLSIISWSVYEFMSCKVQLILPADNDVTIPCHWLPHEKGF